MRFVILFLLAASWSLTACESKRRHHRVHRPSIEGRSILVIPPLNESTEVTATNDFLSVVSRPLSESGFYVFPVAVVRAFMEQNGLPTAADMNGVPLKRLNGIFKPDLVLYTVIHDWGEDYTVIDSRSRVKLSMRLVDARTGRVVWADAASRKNRSPGSYHDDIAVQLVAAVATKILNDAVENDGSTPLARSICERRILNGSFPRGPLIAESRNFPTKTDSETMEPEEGAHEDLSPDDGPAGRNLPAGQSGPVGR